MSEMTGTPLQANEARARAEMAELIARYPQARSALLPMLHLVQSYDGYVTPHGIEMCADMLGITEAEVSAVATFYTMYKRHPMGRYHVGVCTNTLCAVMGGDAIWEGVSAHLGIGHDETTDDGLISLERIECQAGCDYAPVVAVNWEFLDNQTPVSTIDVIDRLRSGEAVQSTRGPGICTFRQAERVIAGFADGLAEQGPAAGESSLRGLRIAQESTAAAERAAAEQAAAERAAAAEAAAQAAAERAAAAQQQAARTTRRRGPSPATPTATGAASPGVGTGADTETTTGAAAQRPSGHAGGRATGSRTGATAGRRTAARATSSAAEAGTEPTTGQPTAEEPGSTQPGSTQPGPTQAAPKPARRTSAREAAGASQAAGPDHAPTAQAPAEQEAPSSPTGTRAGGKPASRRGAARRPASQRPATRSGTGSATRSDTGSATGEVAEQVTRARRAGSGNESPAETAESDPAHPARPGNEPPTAEDR